VCSLVEDMKLCLPVVLLLPVQGHQSAVLHGPNMNLWGSKQGAPYVFINFFYAQVAPTLPQKVILLLIG
jgi:hypothetical protein